MKERGKLELDKNEDAMLIRMFGPRQRPVQPGLRIISHRGGKGFGPENTLESLRNAIAAGVKMVETDLRQTADGVLVVRHGPLANSKFIKDYTADELRREHPSIATLREFLEVAYGKCFLDLEAKSLDPQILAKTVMDFGMEQQVMITSFNLALLIALKGKYPDFTTGWLVKKHRNAEETVDVALGGGIELLLPRQSLIDDDLIELAHQAGLQVYTWTVNRRSQLRGLVRQGIDGVITDKYDLMTATWQELVQPVAGYAESPIT